MVDKVTVEGDSITVKDSAGNVLYKTPGDTGPVDPPPESGDADIQVGPNRQYKTLKAGIDAAEDGNVIEVDSGTYTNDFSTVSKRGLTIRGVGASKPKLNATSAPGNGKGILVTQGDITIENMEFANCKVSDLNGAGIRYEGGNLTVKDCYFHDNQMGILASASGAGEIIIRDTEFNHNGAPGSNAHNIYINAVAHVMLDNVFSHDNITGHQFKSRAKKTTVTDSRFYDGTGNAEGYNIDIPDGGVTVVRGCTLQQKANPGNVIMLHFGGENPPPSNSSLLVDHCTFVNDHTNVVAVDNRTTFTATVSDNSVWNVPNSKMTQGPATVSGTVQLPTRPPLQ